LRVVLESKLKELEDAAGVVGVDLMENAMVRAQLMEVYDWMKGELVGEFLGALNVAPQKKMGFAEHIRGLFRCCMTVDVVSQRPAFGSVVADADAVVAAAGTGLDAVVAVPAVVAVSAAVVVLDTVQEETAVVDATPAAPEAALSSEAAPASEGEPAHPAGIPLV
jgi:hypothetical protein